MTLDQKTLGLTHLIDLKHSRILRLQVEQELTPGMALMKPHPNTLVLGICQEDNSVVLKLVEDTLNLATVQERELSHRPIKEVSTPSIVHLHPHSHKSSGEDHGKDIRFLLSGFYPSPCSITLHCCASIANKTTFLFFKTKLIIYFKEK